MKIKRLLFLFSLPLLLAACTSYKNVPYLQNPEAVNDLEGTLPLYDAKIMPKDLLSITVNTTDPQAAAPFNLTVQTPLNAALTNINTTTQPTLQQYLVNNSGEIDFPVIGTLRVGGLTKNEAESLIRERLSALLEGGAHRDGAHGELQDLGLGRGGPSGQLHDRQREGERSGGVGDGRRHDDLRRT